MERGLAPLERFRVGLVIARGVGVEVPAEVIETHRRIGQQGRHIRGGLVLQVMEAHHHVGHLDAGVVDVVLHFHAVAAGAQHAHEGIAEGGVAQVADVRRLVGVDVGVLDDDLAANGRGRRGALVRQQRRREGAAVEPQVDVAVAGNLHARHAIDGRHFVHQFLSDLPGGLAQGLGELERGRDRHVAQVALPRLLDGHRQVNAVADLYVCAKRAGDVLFDGMEHGKLRV